jgi:hypothetical protein
MSEYLRVGSFLGAGYKFLNDVRDTAATGAPDALGVLPPTAYGGGLVSGAYLRMNDSEALQVSDTVGVGTLYRGIYRRVFFKSGITGGGTTGFKRGQIVFWDLITVLAGTATDPYQVTNVEATDPAQIAGIVINNTDTAGSPLSGFYGWIQTAGLITVQYRTTLSSTSLAIGDTIYWAFAGAGADNGTADDIGGTGTPPTLANVSSYIGRRIGIAIDLPVNNTLKRALMMGWDPSAI